MLAVGATVAVVALAAASTTVKKNFTVEGETNSSHSVSCPKGDLATSGGFTLQQTPTSLEVQASRAAGRKSTVQARSIEIVERSGSVIAMCAKDKGLVVKSKAHTAAATDTDVQVTVHCPKGSMAIGGGGQVTSSGFANQLGSFPTSAGRSWATRWNLPGTQEMGLKAYAVCDKRIPGYNIVEASGALQPLAKRAYISHGTALAKCEGNDRLVGGGYFHLDRGTYFTRVGPKGQGWEASANWSSSSDSPMLSFAICGSR
jgi:hypothetical protein